jgi:hypothetical protein
MPCGVDVRPETAARARLQQRVGARGGKIVVTPDDEGIWSVTVSLPISGPIELMITATEDSLDEAFARADADLDVALGPLRDNG